MVYRDEVLLFLILIPLKASTVKRLCIMGSCKIECLKQKGLLLRVYLFVLEYFGGVYHTHILQQYSSRV